MVLAEQAAADLEEERAYQALLASGDSMALVEINWKCMKCKHKNIPEKKICTNCDSGFKEHAILE
jgi:hypothetical protein